MGTRGSFGVRIGGVDKCAYNHSDSYPDGLGQEFVDQVRELVKIAETVDIKALASQLRLVSNDVRPTPEDIEKYKHLSDLRVSEQKLTDWYCLLRNGQGNLIELLKLGVMLDGGADFLLDSLFCEYAYILNLDTGMVEVYRGFQKAPGSDKGRYAKLHRELMPHEIKDGKKVPDYFGVALVGELPMNAIPEDWEEKMFPPDKDEE